MRSLFETILEKLSLEQYREYGMVKRDPRAQAWLDAFWERVKEMPGAEVSRNGHRVYFKFELPIKDLEVGDQQDAYNSNTAEIKKSIYGYINVVLGHEIEKFDYMHGLVDVSIDTQRGKKTRTLKIGKLLKDRPDLMDAFAADPVRLTSKLDTKKLMIVLSNHAYDIAGMSTDRKWTSCMNIITGSNAKWVKEDIKWGTVVAYLIEADDKNIENPLGRILIKPYLDDNQAVVYFPEPTVYSPYVGLDSMRDYLQDMCNVIANRVSWLYKIARDSQDPNQIAPDRTILNKADFTKEDWKVIDEVTDKEWEKLEKRQDEKYKFLLYYDDYFATNKNYIGMRPHTPRGKESNKKI